MHLNPAATAFLATPPPSLQLKYQVHINSLQYFWILESLINVPVVHHGLAAQSIAKVIERLFPVKFFIGVDKM